MRAKRKRAKERGYLAVVLSAAILATILGKVVFLYARVPTDSMAPYINANQTIVASRLFRLMAEPERGDVVVFKKRSLGRHYIVKRIIGTPNDAVQIVCGTVYVDGEPILEPYVLYGDDTNMDLVTVPNGTYFVMGDNRVHSNDSSDWPDRFVLTEELAAKVILVF